MSVTQRGRRSSLANLRVIIQSCCHATHTSPTGYAAVQWIAPRGHTSKRDRGTPSMIQPEKAAVRPRIIRVLSDQSILLEDAIHELLARKYVGRVLLCGPPGSGKTTALRHLAAVLPSDAGLVFLDEPDLVEIAKAPTGVLQ